MTGGLDARLASPTSTERCPDAVGAQRHLQVAHSERRQGVDRRVDDAREGRRDAAFTAAFDAQRIAGPIGPARPRRVMRGDDVVDVRVFAGELDAVADFGEGIGNRCWRCGATGDDDRIDSDGCGIDAGDTVTVSCALL